MRRLVNLMTGEVREVNDEEYQNTCDELGRSYMPAPDGWCWYSQMIGSDWLRIAERLKEKIAGLEATLAEVTPVIDITTQSIFDWTASIESIRELFDKDK